MARTASHDVFPCLVQNGRELEDPATAASDEALYGINARNGLRHLTYGTPLFRGSLLSPANRRLAWINFRGLMLERDPLMLGALRKELQNILINACQKLRDGEINEIRCQRFIYTLLSNLPFMDPEHGQTVWIPQKIKNARQETEWKLVEYTIRKIDISPRTGWRAALLSEEDRVYAFGLEPNPQAEGAQPVLLLMGTTYPSGQGFQLSLLADITPDRSVGEIHDRTALKEWIDQHENIVVTGHSQGGSLAQLVAGESVKTDSPSPIAEVHCLNPTALHKSTHDRLSENWNACDPVNRPEIHVYTQAGDPVFRFGDNFLEGTRVHFIDSWDRRQASALAAHAHHFMAHPFGTLQEDVVYETSHRNLFANNFKAVSDRILSPLWTLRFAWLGIRKKVSAFYDRYRDEIFALSALAMMMGGLFVLASGVFMPLALATGIGCVSASVLAARILPPLTDIVLTVATYAISAIVTALAFTAVFTVGTLCAAIMTGVQGLFRRTPPARAGGKPLEGVSVEPSTRPLSSMARIGQRIGLSKTFEEAHSVEKPLLRRTSSDPLLSPYPQRRAKSDMNETSASTPVSGMAL